jgi:cysteine-rich repeat protein
MASARRALGMVAVLALLGGGCSEGGGGDPCGNGRLDDGEACDDGLANDDTAPGACRTDCTAPRCGDGVVDPGEACDDGEENSDQKPDACRVDCTAPRCGDGVRDREEECDWGAANDDTRETGCRTNCRFPYCGDGVPGAGEECDDGEGNSDTKADACRTDCRRARCGDGALDSGESCDDGERNDDWTADACRLGCRLPACGDGVIDTGEECDDGDPAAKDGCSAGCRLAVPAHCGELQVPLFDLREAGTAEGLGFVAAGTLPAEAGKLPAGRCHGPGAEVFYAFPVPAVGNLVVEVEANGFLPVVAVRRSCWSQDVACAPGEGGAARVVIPDVAPSAGMYFIQVDSADGAGGEYLLTATLRPPLAGGDACAPDGSLGSCEPVARTHGCSDPDGDGRGTCVPLVGDGSPCDPAGAENLCREPSVCREGTCRNSCADGVTQPWEECDDGNLQGGDFCSPTCTLRVGDCDDRVPLDLLWEGEAKRAVWSDDYRRVAHLVRHTCHPDSAGIVARFVAPETGSFAFSVESGLILLSLVATCGEGEPMACPPGPFPDRLQADLVAGQEVQLVVQGAPEWKVGAGPFTVAVDRVACGNGILEGVEECDDGNDDPGDTCNPDCTLPGDDCSDVYVLPPPDASGWTGWSGDLQFYENDTDQPCRNHTGNDVVASFTAPAPGRYFFEARLGNERVVLTPYAGTCGVEPALACIAGPTGRPSTFETTLAAGETIFLSLDQYSGSAEETKFSLSVSPVACGDGHRAGPEECDDGNLVSGDGCDAGCRVEPVPEVEPNDLRSRAQPLAVGRTLGGSLSPGDIDYVALALEAGVAYDFETFVGGWERCEAEEGSARTMLRLHGPDGRLLELERGWGLRSCARNSYVPEASGTYFLRVEEPDSEEVRGYLLRTGRIEP